MVAADVRRRISRPDRTASASSPGCAKTPKWHFGRTKKGFSDPSPPKKTRHIETVEVVFPGSPAGEEFSHSLLRRRLRHRLLRIQKALQVAHARGMPQLAQGLGLDLPNPFAGHTVH